MNALLRAAAVIAILAAVASCGRKTEPLTPDSPRPAAVTDVKIAVRDAVAYLSWPVPAKNVEGKDLSPADVKGFRIYRAESGLLLKRRLYRQVAEISMASPAPAEVRNGIVFWSDPGLQYGKVYVYRIRAYSTKGGVSGYSDEVRAAPLLSLAAPKNLLTAGGDGVVTLTWDAVTTKSDGSVHQGFAGYLVFRGMEPGKYDDAPLNKEPVTAGVYEDSTVVNGKRYYYRVRSVDSPVRPWQESLDSSEVTATPKDKTPPGPPTGITVVPGIGRVFLTWNDNREQDLAGYHVYRSLHAGGEQERLTAKPLNRTTFSDETVKQGATYYYSITAVDTNGNESARSKEKKTYTEKIR
jgi:fibronectin type 3 domain-containing protein/predicted small lipoprotein YifL